MYMYYIYRLCTPCDFHLATGLPERAKPRGTENIFNLSILFITKQWRFYGSRGPGPKSSAGLLFESVRDFLSILS